MIYYVNHDNISYSLYRYNSNHSNIVLNLQDNKDEYSSYFIPQ